MGSWDQNLVIIAYVGFKSQRWIDQALPTPLFQYFVLPPYSYILRCNFVNVYMIRYRVHVYTRESLVNTTWSNTGCPQTGTILLYALTLSSINRFSKLFDCQNQEKICDNTITKIPPHFKYVATLPCEMSLSGANCHSVELITPLVSGIAGFNASSSSKADTLNIRC